MTFQILSCLTNALSPCFYGIFFGQIKIVLNFTGFEHSVLLAMANLPVKFIRTAQLICR